MDDAPLVRGMECVGDGDGDPDGLVDGELPFAIDPVPQRLALDVGHDVEEEAVRLARIEEGQDVGMLQVGRGLDLRQEALRAHDGGQLGLEDLERDLAVVLQIAGQIHEGHPALPQLSLEGVAAGQRFAETRGQIEHGDKMRRHALARDRVLP